MPFEKIDFRSFDGAVIFPSRCCIKVKLAHKMKKANWLYPRGVSLSLCPRARCCWGFRPRSRWHLADGKSSSAQGTVAMATIHFNILKTTVKIFPVTGFNYLDFFSGDLATLQWHLPDGKSWGGCHGDDTLEHIKTVKIFPVLYFNYFDFFSDLATLQWHLPDGKSWDGCHGDDTLEHIKTVTIFPVIYFNHFGVILIYFLEWCGNAGMSSRRRSASAALNVHFAWAFTCRFLINFGYQSCKHGIRPRLGFMLEFPSSLAMTKMPSIEREGRFSWRRAPSGTSSHFLGFISQFPSWSWWLGARRFINKSVSLCLTFNLGGCWTIFIWHWELCGPFPPSPPFLPHRSSSPAPAWNDRGYY